MTINPNTIAAFKGVRFENVPFSIAAQAIPSRIVIVGTGDPGLSIVPFNEPTRVFSAEEVGTKTGFGFMLHRLAEQVFLASQNIETWIILQDEAGGATAADGGVDLSGTNITKAGPAYFYAGADLVQVNTEVGDDADALAVKLVAAAGEIEGLSVNASGALNPATFTAKSKGPWGEKISLAFNIRPGETLPEGMVVFSIDDFLTGGTGIPDIQDALNAMGEGDQQNEEFFTLLVHGYGGDTTTLDKIAAYNGLPNPATGNYAQEVGRPFTSLYGDTDPGTDALTALIAAADLRTETDATSSVLAVPDSYHHADELAASAIGIMARIQNLRPQQNVVDEIMPGIIPAPKTALATGDGRWTDVFDNRSLAVDKGVSPTRTVNNVVKLQNIRTFYRPSSLPLSNNVFASQRNVAITRNIWNDLVVRFSTEKWQGFTVVAETADVTSVIDQEKARDDGDVLDTLLEAVSEYKKKSWIYTDTFTIEQLQQGDKVITRANGTGWDFILPLIYSGEGGIINGLVQCDISLAVVLA